VLRGPNGEQVGSAKFAMQQDTIIFSTTTGQPPNHWSAQGSVKYTVNSLGSVMSGEHPQQDGHEFVEEPHLVPQA